MKPTWKKYLLYATYTLLVSGLLYGLLKLILSGYTVSWTGFQTKSFWDWMELFIIPLALALGAFFLNRSERAVEREATEKRAELEREIAKDHQQEATFQSYLDRMSELILDNKLEVNEDRMEGRKVAKIRTISVLRVLDKERQNLVIQFLRDAKLVTDSNSILNETDMTGVNLMYLDLSEIFLQKVNFLMADFGKFASLRMTDLNASILIGAKMYGALLMRANLQSASLNNANLELANLSEANLQFALLNNSNLKRTFLGGANLKGAFLEEANLENADLEEANLIQVSLKNANLKGAKVTPEQLAQAKSLKGTIMPDGTVHE